MFAIWHDSMGTGCLILIVCGIIYFFGKFIKEGLDDPPTPVLIVILVIFYFTILAAIAYGIVKLITWIF